ncbi:MAG: hypothetical protein ABI352_09715 [Candidatus Dormibacter sp.]
MNLLPYVETIHEQLAAAAEAGGEDARQLAERLTAPLDAAIRLALQDALAVAADEITLELAPASVELRIRGRNPEFVVTPAPREGPDDVAASGYHGAPNLGPPGKGDGEDGEMTRINLRMPEHLKARVEQAANYEGLSVNSWLVRAASAALNRPEPDRGRGGRPSRSAGRFTGWVR